MEYDNKEHIKELLQPIFDAMPEERIARLEKAYNELWPALSEAISKVILANNEKLLSEINRVNNIFDARLSALEDKKKVGE